MALQASAQRLAIRGGSAYTAARRFTALSKPEWADATDMVAEQYRRKPWYGRWWWASDASCARAGGSAFFRASDPLEHLSEAIGVWRRGEAPAPAPLCRPDGRPTHRV